MVKIVLVFEANLAGKAKQLVAIEEAIRAAQFIRNKCLRYLMDGWDVKRNDLQKLCADLAQKFEGASKLDSQPRQTAADRAWQTINPFYDNCKNKVPGKKGYPKFKHGAVVIFVGTMAKAIGLGNPSNSYGFIRFRAKVN